MTLNIAPVRVAGISSRNKPTYLGILESAWQDHLKSKEPDAPTVISTFAGGGGSSLGYSMAGYRELLAVEWDNNAVATFKLNFPEVPVYHGDIAKLTVEECLRLAGIEPGELDLFDGSPPCQGFSTAGKRLLDDPRNQLFREYVRLLRGLRPKVFVMENVSGMVKGKMKLVFAEILRELKASGYRVSARLMNAMYFNVPQSRERMIFIGVRDDLGIEPSHPKGESRPVTVREAIADLGNAQMVGIDHIWKDETEKSKYWQVAIKTKQGQKCREAGHYIRMYWDKPSPTITKPGLPNMPALIANFHMHPAFNRVPSVREMARLSSLPDQYRFINPLTDGVNRIGNSVPPLMIRSIARHIRQEILSKTGRDPIRLSE